MDRLGLGCKNKHTDAATSVVTDPASGFGRVKDARHRHVGREVHKGRGTSEEPQTVSTHRDTGAEQGGPPHPQSCSRKNPEIKVHRLLSTCLWLKVALKSGFYSRTSAISMTGPSTSNSTSNPVDFRPNGYSVTHQQLNHPSRSFTRNLRD